MNEYFCWLLITAVIVMPTMVIAAMKKNINRWQRITLMAEALDDQVENAQEIPMNTRQMSALALAQTRMHDILFKESMNTSVFDPWTYAPPMDLEIAMEQVRRALDDIYNGTGERKWNGL